MQYTNHCQNIRRMIYKHKRARRRNTYWQWKKQQPAQNQNISAEKKCLQKQQKYPARLNL